jgi:hypothetical protein
MAIQQITKVQSADPVINRIQIQLAKLNPVLANPLLNGNIVTATLNSSAPVAIPHKLGRPWQGWTLVEVDASVNVYRVGNDNAQQVLNLQASGACTVSVLIF